VPVIVKMAAVINEIKSGGMEYPEALNYYKNGEK